MKSDGKDVMFYKIILLLMLFLIFGNCSTKSNTDYFATLLAQPAITAVIPQVGNPNITNAFESFAATEVVIQGRGFSQVITDNVVKFSGIQATVISATETEITTTVPNGTITGVLSVAEAGKGGVCSSPDGRYGVYCASTDFYINCYAPYLNKYGAENIVNPGENITVNYKNANDVKAYKSSIINSGVIRITCPGDIVVSRFSRSCAQDYLYGTATSATPYEFTVTGTYTIQYFITSGFAGDCKIEVF